jgi:hypothetical protein
MIQALPKLVINLITLGSNFDNLRRLCKIGRLESDSYLNLYLFYFMSIALDSSFAKFALISAPVGPKLIFG